MKMAQLRASPCLTLTDNFAKVAILSTLLLLFHCTVFKVFYEVWAIPILFQSFINVRTS